MNRSPSLARLLPSKLKEAHPIPAELDRLLKVGALTLPKTVRETWRRRLDKLRRELEQTACSAPWIDNCWSEGGVFPPAAQTTPMRVCQCERCQRTGRLWPAHYFYPASIDGKSLFISYECWIDSLSDRDAALFPSSPSGIALNALRQGKTILPRRRTHRKVDPRFSCRPKKSRIPDGDTEI